MLTYKKFVFVQEGPDMDSPPAPNQGIIVIGRYGTKGTSKDIVVGVGHLCYTTGKE
jgi:hypothetical protein